MKSYDDLNRKIYTLKAIVNAQAQDEGLWFINDKIEINYIQQELRKLHAAIEDL